MTGAAVPPLRFFVLGATGRTGLPFLAQALARGHRVTILVRNPSKLPPGLASHPNLRAVAGELDDADKMADAIGEAKPDVAYVMLASERAPHTAVSTGTHSVLLALRAIGPRAMPLISIAGWGLGPTGIHITGFARLVVQAAKTLFWSKPYADFIKQLAEIEDAKAEGLIRPTLVLPPILSNGERTSTYLSGEAGMMKDVMAVTGSVSRASMADLCLKLGERAAAGEAVPQWVAITNP
jgi:putative NADH-flavin reductase